MSKKPTPPNTSIRIFDFSSLILIEFSKVREIIRISVEKTDGQGSFVVNRFEHVCWQGRGLAKAQAKVINAEVIIPIRFLHKLNSIKPIAASNKAFSTLRFNSAGPNSRSHNP